MRSAGSRLRLGGAARRPDAVRGHWDLHRVRLGSCITDDRVAPADPLYLAHARFHASSNSAYADPTNGPLVSIGQGGSCSRGRSDTGARRVRARSRVSKEKTERRYWLGDVTRRSNALDLKARVFRLDAPRELAASLKRSAEASERCKGSSFQSAMSMLTFYINRAGKGLGRDRRRVFERAKHELRRALGRA